MDSKIPVFKENAIYLRPWKKGDEPSLIRHANNEKIWAQLRDSFPHPYTEQDALEWIEMQQPGLKCYHYAIAKNDEPIGGIGIIPQEDVFLHSAELGFWLGEEFWNNGIMTATVEIFSQWALKKLNFLRVYCTIFENNYASMRVLQKARFQHEGVLRKAAVKNNKVLDIYMFSKIKDDLEEN